MSKCVYAACLLLLHSARARQLWLAAGLQSSGIHDEEITDEFLEPGALPLSPTGRSLQKADCETYRSADGSTVRKECNLSGGHALAASAIALIATFSCIAVCCLPLLILLCCAAKASKRKREQQLVGKQDGADPAAYMAQGYPMGPDAPVGTVSPYPPAGDIAPDGKGASAQPPYGFQGHPYAPSPPAMHAQHAGHAAADHNNHGHMAAASHAAGGAAV